MSTRQKMSSSKSQRRIAAERNQAAQRIFDFIDAYAQTSLRIFDPEDDEYDRYSIRGRSASRPPPERSALTRPGSRQQSRQGKEVKDFSKAMKSLYKTIGSAEAFYGQFLNDFESDIQNIKDYAGPELLKKMWRNKVENKKQKEDEESYQDMFDKQRTSLLATMRDFVGSVLDKDTVRGWRDEDSKDKEELVEALRQKVSFYCAQIRPILKGTPDRHSCKRVLGDLKLLKEAVDPDSELNKDLFKKSGDGGSGNGGNDNGGSGNGGDDEGDEGAADNSNENQWG